MPFQAQKMDRKSHLTVRIINAFIHFKHESCSNDAVGAKLAWNKAKGRLRSSDLESAWSIDLHKCYEQMVFTSWMTFV
jgi:hypothetical protein